MAKRAATTGEIVLGWVAILCFGVTLYVLVYFGFPWVTGIVSDIDLRVGAGILALVGTTVTVILKNRLEEAATRRERLLEKKIPLLERFVALIFDLFRGVKGVKAPLAEKDMIGRMIDITQDSVIWASDDVLRAFGTFRQVSQDQAAGKVPPVQALFTIEDLLFAIRKEVGHKNKDLKRGGILRLFINDIGKAST